jgi:hypothetical protein
MSTYRPARGGRPQVDPGDLDRRQVRRLRAAARRAQTSAPAAAPPDPEPDARARAIAEQAWAPRSVEEYMAADWFAYERADRPDPEVRL